MSIYTKLRIILSIVIIAAFAPLCWFDAIPRLDAMAGDLLLRSGGETSPEIIILAIDDYSIDELGRFPWPRSAYAAALTNLADGGAAVIGMDILFTEPSDEAEDEALMEAIAYAGNVVLPIQADIGVERKTDTGMEQVSAIGEDGLILAYGARYPIPMLAAQALDFGHINTLPDTWDSFVRRGMGTFRNTGDGGLIRPWSEIIYDNYCRAMGKETPQRQLSAYHDRPYIHFSGQPGTITHYPFFAALDPDIIDPSEFEGKIVLIGAYATDLGDDSFFTPASGSVRMYGVEIHANMLSNLLSGSYVVPAPTWLNVGALLIICAAMTALFSRIQRAYLKLCVFAASAAAVMGGYMLLFQSGRLMSVSYSLTALLLMYLTDVVVSYSETFIEKRRITNMFGRYLAPQVLEKVIQDGEDSLKLGGEERELTVLFVDIRGFTSLSEVLSPSEVVEILNEYLTLATDAIFEYGGMLDKYIGDAVMAMYNVPYEQDNHVLRAVKSAIHMRDNGAALQASLIERYGRSVQFGVGVNTGRAVVGNIGSAVRMDYTAIGDTVNVAARLESNAKAMQILISYAVYEQVKDEIDVTPLGFLKVKGRESEVQTYLVNGLKTDSAIADRIPEMSGAGR